MHCLAEAAELAREVSQIYPAIAWHEDRPSLPSLIPGAVGSGPADPFEEAPGSRGQW
jgi:hypothetical protein